MPVFHHTQSLDDMLRLCSGRPRVRRIRVTAEFDLFRLRQLQYILEVPPNLHQGILGIPFSNRPGPEADSEKSFADIHDHAHDLVVALVLERLTNRGQLGVQPQLVDIDQFLVFERVRPFPAVFVLRIFPFWSDASLEQVIIGFDGQVVAGGDVVLAVCQKQRSR